MSNKVAIYCRLSEEDKFKKNKGDDSGSIQNQKLMLTEYAIQQHWEIYQIYSDDDYAGSNRNRPAFNQMISDAKNGLFNIVLCKTQSRFTRELELVELYIHTLFPEWGIRFVSIVDNIDTDVAGNKKARQINGLINEWYLEDMSDSIKAALRTRMKAGFFIGSFAPYGYKKDPVNKGHLIPDEETAFVVREIFRLYNSGIGKTRIAKILNERGIPSPAEYYSLKGIKKHRKGLDRKSYWEYYTISHILENEVYLGHLVQGQTFNPTYKSKHTRSAPKEKWIRVENTHEPVISEDDWRMTRLLWDSKDQPHTSNRQITPNKYSHLVKCAKCGCYMGVAYSKHKRYFRCNSAKYGRCCCAGTTVFESTLDKAVLAEIDRLRDMYIDSDYVNENIDTTDPLEERKQYLLKQAAILESQINECSTALKNLYIDKLKGIITAAQFADLSKQFEDERYNHEQQLKQNTDTIRLITEQQQAIKDRDIVVKRLLSFSSVTIELVNEMIDHIEVDGTKRNRIINIYWNF